MKKEKKGKKTYVLTVSRNFMAGHPRKGEPTNFKPQILDLIKLHTMRAGVYWQKVVEEVNAGLAILSVREWSGLPYKSPQKVITEFTALGWQSVKVVYGRRLGSKHPDVIVDGVNLDSIKVVKLANNDGLSYADFLGWFKNDFEGGIIHFSNLRY